jgi:hypothetical protein
MNDDNNVNVYSLKYTEIPRVLFTPYRGRWRQQHASLITTARSYCGLHHSRKQHTKCNNGIKENSGVLSHCCNSIRGDFCEPKVTSDPPHCFNSVFQQCPSFPLLQHCVLKTASVPTVATLCSNNHLCSNYSNNVFQQWLLGQRVALFLGKRDRRTDTNGPIRRSSLTLKGWINNNNNKYLHISCTPGCQDS